MVQHLGCLAVVLFCGLSSSYSQTECLSWTVDTLKSCIEFDTITGQANVADFYPDFKEKGNSQKLTFQIEENRLKLRAFWNKTVIGSELYEFDIISKDESKMALSLVSKSKNAGGFILELLGGEYLTFKCSEIGCKEFYSSKK